MPCALVVGNEQNLPVSIVVLLERRAKLLWFLFPEFLEARIVPQRIEHRIEPEQRGSEWRNLSEKFSVYCFGAREATICSKRGSPRSGSQNGSSFKAP